MPFQIGVDSADEFNKYLINVVVVTASVAWLLLLFFSSIDEKVYKYRKPFSIAMTLQLLFVTLRNLSTMMLSSGFPIPCRWVAVVGGIIYQLFAISAECAMLIRCRSFTRYPKMVTYLAIPTWVVRLGLCIWLVTTIKGENNVAGYVCNTSMNYNLSAIMQYFKIATELIILVFFLERVIALHYSTAANSDHIQWRRLALINASITFLVILSEILVGQITVYLQDYLFLTYSLVNLIQANLVIFVVEDTKSVFRKRAAASNSASKQNSSNSGSRSNGQRDNMEEYDDRTVSYADGVSAAKVGRLNDSYNNNSASTRAFTPKPETLPVRYNSNDHPDSSIYDFSQIDQKMSPNHPWDVDAEYMINGSNRWRHGKGEDEIPMTLAKCQEDAHGFHNI